MTRRHFALCIALGLLVSAGACASVERVTSTTDVIVEQPSPGPELDAARARWAATRPQKYEYIVGISCFCGQDFRRPVRVFVDGTTVISRTYADDGAVVNPQWASSYPSIDALFDIIRDTKNFNTSTVVATYDAARGLPLRVSIDYVLQMADDEMYYTTSGFTAR